MTISSEVLTVLTKVADSMFDKMIEYIRLAKEKRFLDTTLKFIQWVEE